GKTDGAPESVVQTVNWTMTTDDVTGEITSATPSADYGEVATPNWMAIHLTRPRWPKKHRS
uniref:hypothetical protein n=1 Tax=Lacticaseibacillus camelliae TaxID=381742 RepID=UPI001CDA80F5